jgi:hypothetical protein
MGASEGFGGAGCFARAAGHKFLAGKNTISSAGEFDLVMLIEDCFRLGPVSEIHPDR